MIIKGGRLIDPLNKIDKKADVLINEGRVERVEDRVNAKNAEVIDASGMVVCPGLVDMHVHLREPGREDEETIQTGCKAAIAGGITSIACMPNTQPVNDHESVCSSIIEKAAEVGLADVYPIGAISKGLEGKSLSEMAHLAEAGAVAFSDDGKTVMDSNLLRRAFEYANSLGKPLIVHCEDENLSDAGQINESYISTVLGLKGIPAEAEEFIIARDISLAKLSGARVHIAHVSTSGSVSLIREAKKHDLPVTAEVTPHHLFLDEEMLTDYDTNLKVNPPLRSKKDTEALVKGLRDGTIDAIATDHAPHAAFEKEKEFIYAPFGMVGLETMLPLCITNLDMNLSTLIEKLTVNPAKILDIKAGNLSQGSRADILIFNNNAKVEVDSSNFFSMSKNTPYNGMKLKGKIESVIKKGKVVFKEGKFVE
ncbi:MAG: dihydroorotase [Actinobacteria bacterium]|nr:MAG: dihydroorotase [Actinomycetota bacterium]